MDNGQLSNDNNSWDELKGRIYLTFLSISIQGDLIQFNNQTDFTVLKFYTNAIQMCGSV